MIPNVKCSDKLISSNLGTNAYSLFMHCRMSSKFDKYSMIETDGISAKPYIQKKFNSMNLFSMSSVIT